MGVVFFPSFPFLGVILFPSFVLGNAFGGSGVLLVPLSSFSPFLSLSLLSSPSHSFSHSLFLSFSFSLPLFLFSSPFPLIFLLPPLLVRTLFFFFEGTACTVYFRDVRDDTVDCNQFYLHWNKENISILAHEFVYSDVCNFELSVFLLSRCPAFLLMRTLNKVINKRTCVSES